MGKSPKYIGSSDAPPIIGVPSYGVTAIDVWERMTGLVSDEREPSAIMRWGLKLEPLIVAEYEAQTGRKVNRRRRRFYLEGHPYIGATVDGTTEDRVVEAKFTPGLFEKYGEPGDGLEGLPLYVRVQVLHQMMVTGFDRVDVAVLLRGYDLRIFEVEANPTWQADLRDELVEWYHAHVVTRIPPVLDDPEQLAAYMQRQPDDGSTILAPATLSPVFRQLAEGRHDEKLGKLRKVAAEKLIKATMGLATFLKGQDVEVRWRHTKPSPEVKWELVAGSLRKAIERELDMVDSGDMSETALPSREDLDAIVSLYTTLKSERRFYPKFSGELAALEAIADDDVPAEMEVTDAIAGTADAG